MSEISSKTTVSSNSSSPLNAGADIEETVELVTVEKLFVQEMLDEATDILKMSQSLIYVPNINGWMSVSELIIIFSLIQHMY